MSSIRAESTFLAARDYIFTNLFPRLQALQTEIGDGIAFEDWAGTYDYGVNPSNLDGYPALILEQSAIGIEDHRSRVGLSPGADLLIMLSEGEASGESATKLRRYADAIINLVADDPTLGGVCMNTQLTKIDIGFGRGAGQDRGLVLAHLIFEN